MLRFSRGPHFCKGGIFVTLFGLLWVTLIIILVLASYTDLRSMEIPNGLVLVGILVGALEHGIFQGPHGFVVHLLSGFVWLAMGPIFSRITKFGGGDAKLFAMIAVYTGVFGVPLILAGAMAVQLMVFVIRFARGRMALELPFAPAITMGSVGLFLGQLIFMKGGF